MRTPLPIGRKRLPKGAQIKRWTARTLVDKYLYLEQLARERGQELAYTLNQVIAEHEEQRKFHDQQ